MLIAHHFGIKRAGKSDDEYAMSLIEKTEEIITALKLNVKLKDLGVEKDKLQKIAKEAFATMGFAIENNPAEIDENGILRLLENSY